MSEKLQPFEGSLPVADMGRQIQQIQGLMKNHMNPGDKKDHYDVIPGCGKKPVLLKAGAEKLNFMFRLSPAFIIEKTTMPNNHREYEITCTLTHIPTGEVWGQGVGSCSTMEGKYRFRTGDVSFTGKPVPKEYWNDRDVKLIGGKGHSVKKNEDGKWEIVTAGEKVEHDNPADYYNTVLKMGKKRAMVDAVLTVTAASDIFTQDIEEMEKDGLIDSDKVQEENKSEKYKKDPPAKSTKSEDESPEKTLDELKDDFENEMLLHLPNQDAIEDWFLGQQKNHDEEKYGPKLASPMEIKTKKQLGMFKGKFRKEFGEPQKDLLPEVDINNE